MAEAGVGYYGTGPMTDAFSSDKVLLNPYTQVKVLSNFFSIPASWLMTMAEWKPIYM